MTVVGEVRRVTWLPLHVYEALRSRLRRIIRGEKLARSFNCGLVDIKLDLFGPWSGSCGVGVLSSEASVPVPPSCVYGRCMVEDN